MANANADYNCLIPDDKLEELGLVKDTTMDDKTIYWAATSTGLSSEAIKEYLTGSKFSNNMLSPVTTGSRGIDEEVTLYKAPGRGEPSINIAAPKSQYVYLELAFKVLDKDGNAVNGNHIWITDTLAQAAAADKLGAEKAIRTYIENKSAEASSLPTPYFLLNPSKKVGNAGTTKVAGLLNLTGQGDVYDTFLDGKEIVYGDYNLTGSELVYSDTRYVVPSDPAEYTLDNVNGVTEDVDTPSTFLAKHMDGCYKVDTTSFTPKTASYDTLESIMPDEDISSGKYDEDSGKAVACTDSANNIGYANITIFIEGWDHAVVDRINGYAFNLGLQFEINRS